MPCFASYRPHHLSRSRKTLCRQGDPVLEKESPPHLDEYLPDFDVQLTSPWPFLCMAVGWSWVFWITTLVLNLNMRALPGSLLVAIGSVSPILAALFLNSLHETRAFRRNFWQRILDPRRIGPSWLLAILLIPLGTTALAVGAGALAGERAPDWQELLQYLQHPMTTLPLILFFLLFGPIPEEPGWRGYALDRLVRDHGKIVASLILGLVWAVWHMPMFYVQGSLLGQRFVPGTELFWLGWFVPVVGRAAIFTWVFYGTRHSILAVILLHFLFNLVGELLKLPADMMLWRSLFEMVIATIIVAGWYRGGQHRPRVAGVRNREQGTKTG